jgi:hypothetical protein
MSALKTAVLELVKNGVTVQNKIKVSIPDKTQAEVLNALTELVNEGELSVTNNRVRGNVYAINFRQPLPPLEEGAPAVLPTTDSFPEKEPITEKVPEPPTQEDWDELNKLADEQEAALADTPTPVADFPPVIADDAPDKVVSGNLGSNPSDLGIKKGSKPNPVDPGNKVSSIKK